MTDSLSVLSSPVSGAIVLTSGTTKMLSIVTSPVSEVSLPGSYASAATAAITVVHATIETPGVKLAIDRASEVCSE